MIPTREKLGKFPLTALILYGLGAIAVYFIFFFYNKILSDLFCESRVGSAIFSLAIIIMAAGFYGSTVSIIIRCTVERSIECNGTRKG